MRPLVACHAKNDQILSVVIAELASRFDVVDLKIFCSPATLAAPAIPFEDFAAEPAVGFRV
jgi:hypothetical protein